MQTMKYSNEVTEKIFQNSERLLASAEALAEKGLYQSALFFVITSHEEIKKILLLFDNKERKAWEHSEKLSEENKIVRDAALLFRRMVESNEMFDKMRQQVKNENPGTLDLKKLEQGVKFVKQTLRKLVAQFGERGLELKGLIYLRELCLYVDPNEIHELTESNFKIPYELFHRYRNHVFESLRTGYLEIMNSKKST